MAVNTLKGKLEERLQKTGNVDVDTIEEKSTNIIPFSKTEQQVLSVIPDFVVTLEEAKQRILLLQEFVREMMIPGQDYGTISKCDKPSLFKSGAEKLCDIFGFSKQVDVINRIEDWDKGLFHYEVKAVLTNKRTGFIEAEGVGSCNSNEKKYSTQHSYSIANTILKMAKKRAFIDAVLSATRTSGLFSQDLEDLDGIEPQNPKESPEPIKSPEDMQHKSVEATSNPKPATKSQLNKIQALVNEKNIPINKVRVLIHDRYMVTESKLLTLKQADDFIKYLMSSKAR